MRYCRDVVDTRQQNPSPVVQNRPARGVRVVGIAFVVLCGLFLVGLLAYGITAMIWSSAWNRTVRHEICTVQGKDDYQPQEEKVRENDVFHVDTTSCGMFVLTATPVLSATRSESLYRELEIGHRYRFDLRGWNSSLGYTRNIVAVTADPS
ncbi:MAG: hypothetical protein JWP75_2967 [Frondihabitans sp.]|nr:hypothetical protein [Frondihabitans sp.]